MEQKLYDAAAKLPETSLAFDAIQPVPKAKPHHRTWKIVASIAACFILLISAGFITAEAAEYRNAIAFFQEYNLSTDGLSRAEIKAVYKDITTQSFTYSKTAEVIKQSLSTDQIGGYEIWQDTPTPEDVENLWNYKNYSGGFLGPQTKGGYSYRSEFGDVDGTLSHIESFVEKHDGDTLLWSVRIVAYSVEGCQPVSDGVIVYGYDDHWKANQPTFAWLSKIDNAGNLLWTHMLYNGFQHEYISKILENADGSYAVFSRGDYGYFCLSQYSADGKELSSKNTEIGTRSIVNAARLGDGYIVQLGDYMAGDFSSIVKVDREGNITESFSYSSEDVCYYINDMIEYNGNVYLSAYCVPIPEGTSLGSGRHGEINAIVHYLFANDLWEISSEALTPIVRDNYTAMLLVCDPTTGTPHEFYSVKGSLGGALSLSDSGMLLWDVESITTTFFSPATSLFTIGGVCSVFRYSFDSAGNLLSQEKTGDVTDFMR